MKFVPGKLCKVNCDDCDCWPYANPAFVLEKGTVCMMYYATQDLSNYIVVLIGKSLCQILPCNLDEL